MKLGHNDQCSCGSGRKYKHCCLGNEGATVVDLADRIWRETREAINGYAVVNPLASIGNQAAGGGDVELFD